MRVEKAPPPPSCAGHLPPLRVGPNSIHAWKRAKLIKYEPQLVQQSCHFHDSNKKCTKKRPYFGGQIEKIIIDIKHRRQKNYHPREHLTLITKGNFSFSVFSLILIKV